MREAEERFEAEFERCYGHRGGQKIFELVTFRLVATVPRNLEHGRGWRQDHAGRSEQEQQRRIYLGPGQGMVQVPVLRRSDLSASLRSGPLLVQEYDTTIVVPPRSAASRDHWDNVMIELDA